VIKPTKASPLAAEIPVTGGSLKTKLRAWTIAVFAATLAIFTALGIAQERRQMVELETKRARALLAHLAGMPEFGQTREAALAHLQPLRDLLAATGADVDMVPVMAANPPDRPAVYRVLASRLVALREGTFELRYSVDPNRYREMAQRAVVTHVVHGLLALAVLVAGFEWILRRNLEGPLKTISHQVLLMRHGGWLPRLPKTDRELEELNRAIAGLGPTLENQVHQWIEAERRAAMADVLRSLRRDLEEPRRRVLAVASDLQAQHLIAPEARPKLRALLDDLDRVSRVLADEEQRRFGLDRLRTGELRKDGHE
jgi:hypothetical protein